MRAGEPLKRLHTAFGLTRSGWCTVICSTGRCGDPDRSRSTTPRPWQGEIELGAPRLEVRSAIPLDRGPKGERDKEATSGNVEPSSSARCPCVQPPANAFSGKRNATVDHELDSHDPERSVSQRQLA